VLTLGVLSDEKNARRSGRRWNSISARVSLMALSCVDGAQRASRLLTTYSDPKEAGMRLAVLDAASGALTDLQTPYSAFGALSVVPRPGGRVALALVGGQPTRPSEAALLEVRAPAAAA